MKCLALSAGILALLSAAPSPAQAPDPKAETEHRVKPGETLGGIASRAEVPRILIIEANGLKEPYSLRAGQKLIIPRRRSHVVKDGETGFGIALDYGVPWSVIAAASGIDSKAALRKGQSLIIPTVSATSAVTIPTPAASQSPSTTTSSGRYIWPVEGPIRRSFAARGGSGSFHDGIDIISPAGTAVRASAVGTVIFAGDGPKEYGKTVIIHHGGRWTTTYSFLSRITVKDGEQVAAGERIGLVGETGLATQPQLHFEIRRNREAFDPVRYLPKSD
jgi:murein DD-endopeptidase MepM/ murein hydrolase activator NlpD